MKKFSNLKESDQTKYEMKDYMRNDLYNLIEKSLNIKFLTEDAEKMANVDADIQGKEDLVEELKKYIERIKIQEKKQTLESIKANFHNNFDMKWLNEQIHFLNEDLHWNEQMRNCTSLKALQEYQAQDPNNRTLEDFTAQNHTTYKVLKDKAEKYAYYFLPGEGDAIKFSQEQMIGTYQ